MAARLKDLALGVVAASWLVAAPWMTPAGDVLAAPSGESLPTMCWIRATTGHECPTSAWGALFTGVVRTLVGGLG